MQLVVGPFGYSAGAAIQHIVEQKRRLRRGRTKGAVADLIERFLQNRLAYPQEWNDFVECSDPDPAVNAYRKRCYNLDPLRKLFRPD